MAHLKQEPNQHAISQPSVQVATSQQQALELTKATVNFLGAVSNAFNFNNPNAQGALQKLSSDAVSGHGPKNPVQKLDLSSLVS